MADTTTRAYTLRLSGGATWRDALWRTHVTVNRGAQVWGDWLLTLRGGLPASLADGHPDRRVLLALSWLSVESPASLVPAADVVAHGTDKADERAQKVMDRFRKILALLDIRNRQEWIDACESALSARIRDDAVWVDRSRCFAELQRRFPGLTPQWAAATLFGLLGDADEYFRLPDEEARSSVEAKDFVQKAGGWLSRNWGSGEKSDVGRVGRQLAKLAKTDSRQVVGRSGGQSLVRLLKTIDGSVEPAEDSEELFKQLKQAVGWKGRPSKGALALEKIRDADKVSAELWQRTIEKLKEESADQSAKGRRGSESPDWMPTWRKEMEKDSKLGMPYRVDRDYIWEHGVTFDHALRRVSSAHTWIKRAEAERRTFREDAAKIDAVPKAARDWLDRYCEDRSGASGAAGEYIIRKRAIDGWDKVLQAWAALGSGSTRQQRIEAARDVQANLDESEKFGDIQLFAGFGDEDDDDPRACLADDAAQCVWHRDGAVDPDILKNYVAAAVAEHDQRRFKVPAYRHPDPLRNPIYVDYGNSRWGITYSALKGAADRKRNREKLAKAKTDQTRRKLIEQLDAAPDLRGVSLDIWNGHCVEPIALRWHGKRLWNALDLEHFGQGSQGGAVSRADRLGRIASGQSYKTPVSVADVFEQKDWNGRLQVPRDQLDRLADFVYGKVDGKRVAPDYSKLACLAENPRAVRQWERLRWFLTTSAKLRPHGPWLDYVAAGLPEGIEYKKGRAGYYVDYAVNQGRKGRARLLLARLPGLRVLSLDLGHRHAAACAVWETLSAADLAEEIKGREIGGGGVGKHDLYCHTRHVDQRGKQRTTIYRRIASDKLPDGSRHPAPWARLERQFLIKLQGEDRPARRARQEEIDGVNEFRVFLGLEPLGETPRVDELQKETFRLARHGLRRLGDMARVAYAMTATGKPISGGRTIELTPEQRVEYVQDALLLWQELAASSLYRDKWAANTWQEWLTQRFGGPPPVEVAADVPRLRRGKKNDATRAPLEPVARQLANSESPHAIKLHRLWAEEWNRRQEQWRKHLRWLRRFVLPRKSDVGDDLAKLRGLGGLSVQRLQTIRDLYQVLKAFHMRPEPDDLRKNVPELGDESLAKFGRRILDQLERMREQRIKQLASRVIEAALGAGRVKAARGRDRKRPIEHTDKPCHVVAVENLERYRPEESRLRRENRQLMDWAARNVRKYIGEGCELHGLHFVEVSPSYTSRQDSRTGAPGIRCEDVSRKVLEEAVRRAAASDGAPQEGSAPVAFSRFERDVRRWSREIRRIRQQNAADLKPWEWVLNGVATSLSTLPKSRSIVRLPRRGGELFVSAAQASPTARGIQADLNAAANIGLKALCDPDWEGTWWFVLVNLASGKPVNDKVLGSAAWKEERRILPSGDADSKSPSTQVENGRRPRSGRGKKTDVYAFNPLLAGDPSLTSWMTTKPYWEAIERLVAERLRSGQAEPENPF